MQLTGLQRLTHNPQTIAVAAAFSALVLGVGIAKESWLIIAAVIAIPLVLLWPVQAALGSFVFVIPWDSVSLFGTGGQAGTSLTFYTGSAAVVVLFVTGFLDGRLRKPPRAAAYWTGFVFLCACSITWATNSDVGIERLYTAVPLLALYLVATSVGVTKQELLTIAWLAIAGAVFGSMYAIYHAGGIGRITLSAAGSSTDPNQFANMVLLGASLALGVYLSTKHFYSKVAAGASVAIILYAVLMSMSRGALLSMGVIIAVYLYRMRASRRLIIPVCIGLSLLWFLPSLFFLRLEGFVEGRGEGRFDIWIAGLHALKDHFLFGAGLDNFPVVYQQYAGYAPHFWGYYRAPHNIYLGVAVELGILGIALLLLAMFSQLRDVATVLPRSHTFVWPIAFEAVCWAMVVHGASLDILWRKAFWVSWILLAAAVRMQVQEYEEQEYAVQSQFSAMPEVQQWPEWQGRYRA